MGIGRVLIGLGVVGLCAAGAAVGGWFTPAPSGGDGTSANSPYQRAHNGLSMRVTTTCNQKDTTFNVEVDSIDTLPHTYRVQVDGKAKYATATLQGNQKAQKAATVIITGGTTTISVYSDESLISTKPFAACK